MFKNGGKALILPDCIAIIIIRWCHNLFPTIIVLQFELKTKSGLPELSPEISPDISQSQYWQPLVLDLKFVIWRGNK